MGAWRSRPARGTRACTSRCGYRSSIFYADESQRKIAQAYIAQLGKAKAFGRSIVTRVDALERFYPAEGYHQDFLLEHPDNPYILIHDLPKIINLQKIFPTRYRDQPVRAKAAP